MAAPIRLLFCASPLDGRTVDPAFADETAAAGTCGLAADLVDFEALVTGNDPARAVRRVAVPARPSAAAYRGWMLRPEHYAALYAALAELGVRLLNDPAAYRHCHYLPEAYPVLEGHTPRTVWLRTGPDVPLDRVMAALAPFGAAPVVVKDFVKSRKHEWAEAGFIPSAADAGAPAVEALTMRGTSGAAEGDRLRRLRSAPPHAAASTPAAVAQAHRVLRLPVLAGGAASTPAGRAAPAPGPRAGLAVGPQRSSAGTPNARCGRRGGRLTVPPTPATLPLSTTANLFQQRAATGAGPARAGPGGG